MGPEEGAWQSEQHMDVGYPHHSPRCDVKTSEPGEPPRGGDSTLLQLFPRRINEIPQKGPSVLLEQAARRCQPHLG